MSNLVIVESPAKAKTIEKILGKDYVVKSSFGHVMDLGKKGLGVDIEGGFIPQYEIMPDKVKVVNDLKKAAKAVDTVWLASDEDREGEAIAWHVAQALNLNPETTKRIVFHEITKKAIDKAIENPRVINIDLVNAQTARRVLDRLVGFELSPVLWKKIKPALSAGRVQSVAVRLIVEREEEIRGFASESAYRITAQFIVKNKFGEGILPAELDVRFKTQEEAVSFLEKCIGAEFKIKDLETKPGKKSPSPPFTTSTLQQEAARKLGFSVHKTMVVAQQLYEQGKITYMRTDSVNLSDDAMSMCKEQIDTVFGNKYYKMRKYVTKSKGAQEAHEAIRPSYISQSSINSDNDQVRLYDLIWKRTVASQMADAVVEKTVVDISISKVENLFISKGEVIKFDGFLKLYSESKDDDNSEQDDTRALPIVEIGEKVDPEQILAVQKFSQQPPRYTEASLVRKLEELGIGRPSTYAPTISTIQKRDYILKGNKEGIVREYDYIALNANKIVKSVKTEKVGFEKNKLYPTDTGSVVTNYLKEAFAGIMEYNFTADIEQKFDDIAEGKVVWNKMLAQFYKPFHDNVEENMKKIERITGERLVGVDPTTGKPIYAKIGRFGPLVQLGEPNKDKDDKSEKPQFASILKGQSIDDITVEEALELFKLPRNLGQYEGKDVLVNIGKYGPYVLYDEKFHKMPKTESVMEVTLEKAVEIMLEGAKLPREIGVYKEKVIKVAKGRFGPYIAYDGKFYSVPKTMDPLEITLEQSIELLEEGIKKDASKTIKEFDEDKDIKVLNGRYGAYISYKKKNFKIPSTLDPKNLTLEECKKIIKG